MTSPPSTPDWPTLAPYAGRWVAIVRGRVTGVGWTAAEARRASKHTRPKEQPEVVFVPVVEMPMTTDCLRLPEWPWGPVRALAEERNVCIWPVGGVVRDLLLGRPIHDWDFAVAGETDRAGLDLARAVADAAGGVFFPLDAERGTGRAIVSAPDGSSVELDFALLRGETIEADLRTRDFTINAMALDQRGGLINVVGGEADLQARRLRALGSRTFRADPIRLLRAVRLEADLGFRIESQTAAWIVRDAPLLVESSAERVRDEFMRIVTMEGAAAALRRMNGLGLLERVVPEMEELKDVTQSPPHRFDVFDHALAVVEVLEGVLAVATGKTVGLRVLADVPAWAWGAMTHSLGEFAADVAEHLATELSGGRTRADLLKLMALMHDLGKAETWSQDDEGRIHFYEHEHVGASLAAARLRALRFSRGETRRAHTIVKAHLRPLHLARTERVTRRAIYRYFRATEDAGVDVALLALADHLATWGPALPEDRWARRLEVAQLLLTHYFDRYEQTVASPPLIDGGDLMEVLGLGPGPEIGRLLQAIREAQAVGEVSTPEEALTLAQRLHRA